jgi:hypothetical protein
LPELERTEGLSPAADQLAINTDTDTNIGRSSSRQSELSHAAFALRSAMIGRGR